VASTNLAWVTRRSIEQVFWGYASIVDPKFNEKFHYTPSPLIEIAARGDNDATVNFDVADCYVIVLFIILSELPTKSVD
jgi:hypothetical protein